MAVAAATVDFTNVRDGGQFSKTRFPDGDYKARITKVDEVVPKKDPTAKMWVFTIEVKYKGRTGTYPYYCKLVENQLWKLRQLIAAAGITVPKKRMKVDPNKVVGKYIGVTLQETEYNDKIQSEVQYALPLDKIEPFDGEMTDEDEDEAYDEDEVAGDSEEETEDEVEEEEETEEEEEEPPARPAAKKSAARRPAPEAATPPRRGTVKKGAAKRPAPPVDDDELEDLDLEDL